MCVVEGYRQHATADPEEARRLFDRPKERPFLLGERREEEIAERHSREVFALLRLEAMREEADERWIPLGEDGERAADVAGRGYVEGDADFARRSS